jgi:hypothetical protein
MEIRGGNSVVEIVATEHVPANLPGAGDARLAVRVCSEGFSGESTTWVEAAGLTGFLEQLRALEQRRQGSAQIESMSPGEFQLRIWSVNRLGHVAVGGRLHRQVHGHETGPYQHLLEFGFELDRSLMPSVVSAFQELAQRRA